MLTRALASLGIANFLLLGEWLSVAMVYRHNLAYFVEARYPLTYVWSMVLATLVIAAGLTAASTLFAQLRRPSRSGLVDRLALGATGFVVVGAWISGTTWLVSPPSRTRVAVGLAVVTLACVVRPPGPGVRSGIARALAFTAVLFPISLVDTLVRYATYPTVPPARPARTEPAGPAPTRLVWVVLDELDPAVAFDKRPPGLELPALDRLRTEALVGQNAHAPGAWTLDAMSTLWTGRPVSDARETGPADLRLTFAGSAAPQMLSESTTVFAKAQDAGHRVGIAGWYHPYCRLFAAVAVRCESIASADATFSHRRAAVAAERGALAMVPRLVLWHAPWSTEAIWTGGVVASRTAGELTSVRAERAEIYRRVHARSLEMVRDPSLSLVFAHYPVPHPPGFYDAGRGEIDITGERDYLDNLVLADRAVGELRQALEQSGLWTTTTLLVHSDHALRPRLWTEVGNWPPLLEATTGGRQSPLTPFFLKLAGQEEGAEYAKSFSAALTHDLVLSVLGGRLRSPADVSAWLDVNRARVPLTWPVTTIMDR